MRTILVIDDDDSLRDTIGVLLEQEGFRAVLESDGKAGFERALVTKPDLILVDLRLPTMTGTEVCKQLRAARSPHPSSCSARSVEIDKVLLLEIGADDYVVKPFGTRELSRVSAQVLSKIAARGPSSHLFFRHQRGPGAPGGNTKGAELKLTPAEYNLLTFFLQNPDRPLTRDVILNSVWGYESFPNTRTVDAHVVRLRQKLEPQPDCPRHFLTMHGVDIDSFRKRAPGCVELF